MSRDLDRLYHAGSETAGYQGRSDDAIEAALEACGIGPFTSALELGGSIGVLTESLAPRCRHLTRIDVSATAAAMSRRRLVDFPMVEVVRGKIPDAIPEREYDLVVASEILHLLSSDAFERTLTVIRARLVTGGRLVAVHWRLDGSELPLAAGNVDARLGDDPWLEPVLAEHTPDYLLDVLERR